MNYLQLSPQTRVDRFPKIFSRAKELCPSPKSILSFGCSTGEECFSLAKVFPDVEIFGVDVSYWSISVARRNNKFDMVHFCESLKSEKFDLIFALMVLFALENPISRENYDQAIKEIDKHLNVDGVLVIYTGQFAFTSTEVSKRYDVIKEWNRTHSRNKQKYSCGYYRKKHGLD